MVYVCSVFVAYLACFRLKYEKEACEITSLSQVITFEPDFYEIQRGGHAMATSAP
jgi:hypothetical protein